MSKMTLTQDQIDLIKKNMPNKIAEDIVSVQPMPTDAVKQVIDDPLANAMLNSFFERQTRK